MAFERRGDVSELAVVLALETLGLRLGQSVHWRVTPPGLAVAQPDVTVGADPARPDTLVQVCSSGYAGGYQKKFWRDVGELIEVRRVFPSCRVLNVLFEPGVKERLVTFYDFLSDGVLRVAELPFGPALLAQVETLARSPLPPTGPAKYAAARRDLSPALLAGLGRAIQRLSTRPLARWELRHSPPAPPEDDLSPAFCLRQAILVAALFSAEGQGGERIDSAGPFLSAGLHGRRLPPAGFLPALAELGVCQVGLGPSYTLRDDNLLRCLRALGVPGFLGIAGAALRASPSRLFDYVDLIQQLPAWTRRWFRALLDQHARLCSRAALAAALRANFARRDLFLGEGPAPAEPWLFRRLLDLVRAADGKHFAIGIPRFDPVFTRAGLPALRFILSDYVAGRRPLTSAEASAAASVLAPELRRIRSAVGPRLLPAFRAAVRRSEFRQRLLTYRGFDPLPVLLRERSGVVPRTLVPPVAARLGLRGAATCIAHVAGDTLVMWQGASRSGVAHKARELVGRMGLCCLEVQSDPGGLRTFTFRKDLCNRVLYTDGSWQAPDIEAILAGGFTCVRRVL
jgi:hypothetical protein